MTRFEMEITGQCGEFWKKDAEKRVAYALKQADELGIVEADGAIKWKTNGRYLMDDLCEILEYAGYSFSRKATEAARERQVEEELIAYRNRTAGEEEIREMRNAFGSGTTVVDILSGKLYKL